MRCDRTGEAGQADESDRARRVAERFRAEQERDPPAPAEQGVLGGQTRRERVRRDAAVVQSWLAHPASSWWEMGHLDVEAVRAYLAGVQADPGQAAWLGRRDGVPVFLAETYDPARVL
ncbi:GNAT family N-acetyltransferase, partial [Bacillus sp. S34]|nr:GNAT family N-acetyltransferase [Bacillus sp. S34]